MEFYLLGITVNYQKRLKKNLFGYLNGGKKINFQIKWIFAKKIKIWKNLQGGGVKYPKKFFEYLTSNTGFSGKWLTLSSLMVKNWLKKLLCYTNLYFYYKLYTFWGRGLGDKYKKKQFWIIDLSRKFFNFFCKNSLYSKIQFFIKQPKIDYFFTFSERLYHLTGEKKLNFRLKWIFAKKKLKNLREGLNTQKKYIGPFPQIQGFPVCLKSII